MIDTPGRFRCPVRVLEAVDDGPTPRSASAAPFGTVLRHQGVLACPSFLLCAGAIPGCWGYAQGEPRAPVSLGPQVLGRFPLFPRGYFYPMDTGIEAIQPSPCRAGLDR